MAKVRYNTTLEYATNTLQFQQRTNDGIIEAFDQNTKFSIARLDDPNNPDVYAQTSNSDYAAGFVEFLIDPDRSKLYSVDDTNVDYANPTCFHMYSLKSDDENVYMAGLLNLVEVA